MGGAEEGLEDLGAAGPEKAADAQDLAGVEVEVDAMQRTPPAVTARDVKDEVAGGEDDRSGGADRSGAVAGVTADHGGDQAGATHLGDRGGDDIAPVAEDGYAVGERKDLVDAVRDVDDADASGRQLADDPEEAFAFGRREGGGGLVHDEDAGVEGKGLGDLHELLFTHAKAGSARLGVEVDPEAGEELCRGGDHGAAVEEDSGPARFAAEEDVRGNC